ncbi:hypothetical protein ACFQL4_26515 [Halosimplex aquaticum]
MKSVSVTASAPSSRWRWSSPRPIGTVCSGIRNSTASPASRAMTATLAAAAAISSTDPASAVAATTIWSSSARLSANSAT